MNDDRNNSKKLKIILLLFIFLALLQPQTVIAKKIID